MVVHYTKAAERDLFETGVYTLTEWGDDQFGKYMKLVRATCEEIIPGKHQLARPVEKRPGLKRWRCERHVVYFQRTADGIEIVRIFHDRMLPAKHL